MISLYRTLSLSVSNTLFLSTILSSSTLIFSLFLSHLLSLSIILSISPNFLSLTSSISHSLSLILPLPRSRSYLELQKVCLLCWFTKGNIKTDGIKFSSGTASLPVLLSKTINFWQTWIVLKFFLLFKYFCI